MPPQKFSENVVILCFERRFSKQNSAICLKATILPPKKFWAAYATGRGPRLSNPDLETRAENVWDLDQSDQ